MRLLVAALLLFAALPVQAQSLPQAVRALVDSTHAAGGFDGAVLVWTNGRTASATAGFADRAARRPWTLATRAPWASVSKLVTAAAVLQLAAEGRLRLDDDARPAVPALASGPPVTVRQLLAHLSGAATEPDDEAFYGPDPLATRRRMDSVLAGPRRDAPGASWRYNNLDYVALERVVAAADGRPYAASIEARVLRPLGLRAVRMGAGVEAVGNVVDAAGATPARLSDAALLAFGGAGGLVGDVRDLLKLGRALARGRLLAPALRDTLATAPPRSRSALSVWAYEVEGPRGRTRVIERQGWIAGNRALLLVVPETGAVVAVLASTSTADLGRTASGAGFSARLLTLALHGR